MMVLVLFYFFMILRNLDFHLSLYLIKGVSRFYKTDIPFYYDGILFKSLQSNIFDMQKDIPNQRSDVFFFYCLGLKTDTALSSFVSFHLSDVNEEKEEENNILKSEKSSESVVIDSYYTSYTYKFKYSLYNFSNKYRFKNTVRFFRRKSRRIRYRRRRLLWRFTKRPKCNWWLSVHYTRKLYKRCYGVNSVKAQFTDESFNFSSKFFSFRNQSLFFYRRFLFFISAMFFNLIFSRFYLTYFLRKISLSFLQIYSISLK